MGKVYVKKLLKWIKSEKAYIEYSLQVKNTLLFADVDTCIGIKYKNKE